MRAVPPPDLGDRRDRAAPQPPAAQALVPGGVAGRRAQEREGGPAAVAPARARLLQDRRAAAPQAAPGDGRSRARAAGGLGGGGRDQPLLSHQGRPGRGQARPIARGQAPDRGRGRDRGQGPGRVRLAVIGDYSATTLKTSVSGNVIASSTVVSDGRSGYATLTDVRHKPTVV